jgi:hypothetical protein
LRRHALDPNIPREICVTGDLPIIQVDGPVSSITASPTKKHPQFAAQNAIGASTCTFVLKVSRQKTANKGRRNSAARAGVKDGFLPLYFPSCFAIAIRSR